MLAEPSPIFQTSEPGVMLTSSEEDLGRTYETYSGLTENSAYNGNSVDIGEENVSIRKGNGYFVVHEERTAMRLLHFSVVYRV